MCWTENDLLGLIPSAGLHALADLVPCCHRIQDVISAIGPGQYHAVHPSVYAASDAGKEFPRPVQLAWAFGSGTRAGSATVRGV